MSERHIIMRKDAVLEQCPVSLETVDMNHHCLLKPDHEGDHTNGLRTWNNLFATWYEIVMV